MAKEEKKSEELIPVGDDIETPEKIESEETKQEASEDEKVGQGRDEEESDEGGDESGGESPSDRKRLKRQEERRRHKARIASDRKELDFLRRRNEELERAQSQIAARQDRLEESTVDGRISQLDSQIREAEAIHTEAVKNADGATATEALRVKGELERIRGKLQGSKEERAKAREEETETRETQKPRQQQVVATPDPEAVRNGRAWLRENPWFDPQLQDEDSYLARAIEERLARENEYDPSEPEYWEELNRRIDKRLPGLRKKTTKSRGENVEDDDLWDDDDDRPKKTEKKQPRGPRISVGGRTRALKPNEVHLSAQRIEALKQAGIWDDPEKKQRFLKAYKTYDEEAASRNS